LLEQNPMRQYLSLYVLPAEDVIPLAKFAANAK
jgi:hypothetical protein